MCGALCTVEEEIKAKKYSLKVCKAKHSKLIKHIIIIRRREGEIYEHPFCGWVLTSESVWVEKKRLNMMNFHALLNAVKLNFLLKYQNKIIENFDISFNCTL